MSAGWKTLDTKNNSLTMDDGRKAKTCMTDKETTDRYKR